MTDRHWADERWAAQNAKRSDKASQYSTPELEYSKVIQQRQSTRQAINLIHTDSTKVLFSPCYCILLV